MKPTLSPAALKYLQDVFGVPSLEVLMANPVVIDNIAENAYEEGFPLDVEILRVVCELEAAGAVEE